MRSLLLCFMVILSLTCFSQLDSLKGKIKSVKDRVIYTDKSYFILSLREIDFGQFSLSEEDMFTEFKGDLLPKRFIQLDKEREFDEKGRLIKFTRNYPKINSSFITFYTYDEYDNLVREKNDFGDGNFEVTNKRYRPFKDSADHLITEITYNSDPDRFEMKQYFYNGKVQLAEERELSGFGHDFVINYKYDSSGRLISEIYSNVERVVKYDKNIGAEVFRDSAGENYRTDFMYYKDGSIKEKVSGCSPDLVDCACQKTIYTYDDRGRKSKVFFYSCNDWFSHREYEYNTDNTVRKIAWFYKDEPCPKNYIDYFYKNKEITKGVLTDTDKTTVIGFEYELDSHDNWTEQKKIVNNDLFYTRKREIVYRE